MSKAGSTPPVGVLNLGLVDALVQLTFAVHNVLHRIVGQEDSSITQIRLLGALRDRELTMAQAARLLGVDKSSATGLVDRAQAKGLVDRVASSSDRRSTRLTLSVSGRQLVDRAARQISRDIESASKGMTTGERDQLSRLASAYVYSDAVGRGIDLAEGTTSSSRHSEVA